MNIIVISAGGRPQLLQQSLESARRNSANWSAHTLTLVMDGPRWNTLDEIALADVNTIILPRSFGASACRNIGAGSVPKAFRHEHVLFLDDDVFMCKNWDIRMSWLFEVMPSAIASGYSHPYNHCDAKVGSRITKRDDEGSMKEVAQVKYGCPLLISSVAMMMPWTVFDRFGPWDMPGGPGGSEDYALCMRAKNDVEFMVTDPHCVIHTGMFSSRGEKIVGYDELANQNSQLLVTYGLFDEVTFG